MAKDPAFLFYSNDFISGVSDLTMEERGQYITLLCIQHQKGHLNDKTIRLMVGSVSVDVLRKFEVDKHGCYYNKRLETEAEKRNKFALSRIENGKLGGRPKSTKSKDKTYIKTKKNLKDNVSPPLPVNVNDNENKDDITNKNIPTIEIFLEHCKSVLQNKFPEMEFSLRSKYQTWVDDGWKDGHGNKIKNWKNKINNTIPFIKPIYGKQQSTTETAAERNEGVANLGKLAAAIVENSIHSKD